MKKRDVEKMEEIVEKELWKRAKNEVEFRDLLRWEWGDWRTYEALGIDELALYDKYERVIWNVAMESALDRGRSLYYYLDLFVEDFPDVFPYLEFGYSLEDFKKMVVWFAFDYAIERLRKRWER